MTRQFRHGDVLLEEIDALPSGLVEKGDRVVMEGEATGHAHRLTGPARIFRDPQGALFVRARQGSAIVHEEHARIELPAADYRVVRQREWAPVFGQRYVAD